MNEELIHEEMFLQEMGNLLDEYIKITQVMLDNIKEMKEKTDETL